MKAWRRSEPRDIRPFSGAVQLEQTLDDAAIRLRPDAEPLLEESIKLDPEDFDDLEVVLLPNLPIEELRSTLGERAASYALVLTIRDPVFMRRINKLTLPVGQELPLCVPVAAKEIRELGHGRQLELALALCLVEDRDPEPGRPSVKGSWIARKKFFLGIRVQRSSFEVQPLTEGIRRANHLPEGTLVFAEILVDSANEPLEEGASFARCYVAEPIHAALHSSRKGDALNAVVEAEMIAAVLSSIADQLDDIAVVDEDAPLARVLKQLGHQRSMSLPEFKSLVRKPQMMRAVVHDQLGLVPNLERL